jgi:hypothetical protein
VPVSTGAMEGIKVSKIAIKSVQKLKDTMTAVKIFRQIFFVTSAKTNSTVRKKMKNQNNPW